MQHSFHGDTLDQHHTGWRQVDNSSMRTHTGPAPLGGGRLTIDLWGDILDQHHTTGWGQVDNRSMGGHTGPTPHHWVGAG